MNHYDDRASYFAMLNDQRQYIKCLDANKQADQSLSTYGGKAGTVKPSDMQTEA